MLSVLPITRTRSRENLSNFLSQSAPARSNRLSPSYRSKPRLASRRGCPPLFLRVKAHRERGFAPEDGGGYPPSPRGVWQTIHFIGIRWYRKSGITLRARGYGLQVTGCSSRQSSDEWVADAMGALESQRAESSAWAEDGMTRKRKALFAFGANRAFPVVSVGFFAIGRQGDSEGLAVRRYRGVFGGGKKAWGSVASACHGVARQARPNQGRRFAPLFDF